MSVMLFKLRGVEDDEAEEIRVLLAKHDISFYETSNGSWGLGYAAVWLHDETMFEQAKALIDAYQQQRYQLAHDSYKKLCLDGRQQTVWDIVKERPLQVLLTLIAVAIVCIFALTPFLFL